MTQEIDQSSGTPVHVNNRYISIKFQHGPVKGAGENGCQIEDVLVPLIERLHGFQGGLFYCIENGSALKHLRAALVELNKRTEDREARGVEGTNEK